MQVTPGSPSGCGIPSLSNRISESDNHAGVQDKLIQGQLRHAKAEITRNFYIQRQVDPKTDEAVVNLEMLGNQNGDSQQDA